VQGFAATESDAAHQPSAADIAAVRAFRLTPGFLGKWLALAKDPKMPPPGIVLGKLKDGESVAAASAQLDAWPAVHRELGRQGLSSHDYLVGTVALFAAGFKLAEIEHPDLMKKNGMQSSGPDVATPANVAFMRAHKAEIETAMRAGAAAHGETIPKPAPQQ
ncbi:MAG TPA: hypothetical protein VF286_03910, partial [Acidiphilium sp.]